LAKRYLDEAGADTVAPWLRARGAAISRLAEVEVVSALCRRERQGDLGAASLGRLLAMFDDDLRALRVIEVVPEVVMRARALLRRHPLRASDGLHLASALALQAAWLEPVQFICYDRRLAAAARAEGFATAP